MEINLKFATAIALFKCLKQIKLSISLYTCATIYKLPTNVSSMGKSYREPAKSIPQLYRTKIYYLKNSNLISEKRHIFAYRSLVVIFGQNN